MRTLEYISPTRISKFYENLTEFYLTYLSDNVPPKMLQTEPMAVGSAFDAYTKAYLHEKLFGKGKDPKFDLKTLFEIQVEPQHRDFAWKAGAHAFSEYRHLGALSDLMLELQNSIGEPRFEIEVKGVVNGSREGVTKDVGDITFLGKPDAFFINKAGAHVILDWKVNGYCSKYNTSPMQGFIRLREDGRNKGAHKDAHVMSYKGMMINVAAGLERYNEGWARQLSIYAWLCGMDLGSEFIVAIDQLVCAPTAGLPKIRVAEHRSKVTKEFQLKIFNEAQYIWEVCNSGYIFRDLTEEDSRNRCAALDGIANNFKGELTDNDKWLNEVCR